MEAFDQPWKEKLDGRAEAYWGMFNADRQLKFPFTGPVIEDTELAVEGAGARACSPCCR